MVIEESEKLKRGFGGIKASMEAVRGVQSLSESMELPPLDCVFGKLCSQQRRMWNERPMQPQSLVPVAHRPHEL